MLPCTERGFRITDGRFISVQHVSQWKRPPKPFPLHCGHPPARLTACVHIIPYAMKNAFRPIPCFSANELQVVSVTLRPGGDGTGARRFWSAPRLGRNCLALSP